MRVLLGLTLSISLGLVGGCKKNDKGGDDDDDTTSTGIVGAPGVPSDHDGAYLLVTATVATVAPDKDIAVKVIAANASHVLEGFDAAIDDDSIATVATTDEGIKVTGVRLGDAKVLVTSDSGQTQELLVHVQSSTGLDVGGVLLGYTTTFTYAWGDGGSGGDNDGSYWTPVAPQGYFALGSFGHPGYDDPSGNVAVPVLKAVPGSDALAAPESYEGIWGDGGSGADNDGSVWRPIPPTGYVCLGAVVVPGYSAPSLDAIRCVRKDLTATGTIADMIWDDTGTGADNDFGSWKIAPPKTTVASLQYLPAGTFVGIANHAKPTADSLANVLAFKPVMISVVDDRTVAPELADYNEPDATSEPLLSRVMALPFTLVNDDQHDIAWKIANSPVYHLSRDVYYRLLIFQDNRTGTAEASSSKSDTVGVQTSSSETYSHTWGISITASAGIEIDGLSAGVSTTVTEEFGYSSTESTSELTSNEVTKTLTTPASSSGAMWQKVNRFQLLRREPGADGADTWTSVGDPWEVTIDSYVTSQYPH